MKKTELQMVLKNWRQKWPKSQVCLDPSIHPARAFLSNNKSDPYCAHHYCCCCYFCFCRRCYHLVFQLSEFLIASSTSISEKILKPSVVLCWQFQCFFLSSQNQSPTLTHPSTHPPLQLTVFFRQKLAILAKEIWTHDFCWWCPSQWFADPKFAMITPPFCHHHWWSKAGTTDQLCTLYVSYMH